MPRLWQRVEARQSFVRKLGAYARAFVSVAAGVCFLMVGFEIVSATNPVYTQSYIEWLDDENAPESLAFLDVVHTGHPGDPSVAATVESDMQ